MRFKYLFLLLFIFLSACNISEEEADNFFELAGKNKKEPYLSLQYYDRASAHEKYRIYPVASQLFDIGCYLWQRKDQLDVNEIYLEETIIKSFEIFFEVAQNKNSDPQTKFKSMTTLATLFDPQYSNYHKIAKDLIMQKDPKLLEKINEFLDKEAGNNKSD